MIFFIIGSIGLGSGCDKASLDAPSSNDRMQPSDAAMPEEKANRLAEEQVIPAPPAPLANAVIAPSPAAPPVVPPPPAPALGLLGFPSGVSDFDNHNGSHHESDPCLDLQRPGTSRYVNPLGNNESGLNDCSRRGTPCQTISYAISQAMAGDSIILSDGTFLESAIVIDKKLTIVGKGLERSTIDANAQDRVFLIEPGADIIFCGLSVANGSRTASDERGGGLFIASGANVAILNVLLINNAADLGGGISNEGTLTLTNSFLIGNHAVSGAGLFNEAANASVVESAFIANIATFGGGIKNAEGGVLSINDSTFKNNVADFGAGLENFYADAVISDTTFIKNQAVFGGGIENVKNTLTLSQCVIQGNQATFGGGIDNSGEMNISRSTISENVAETSGGGIENSGVFSLDQSIVVNNLPDNIYEEPTP